MDINTAQVSRSKQGLYLVGAIALVKLAMHLLTANSYGYFIDELYTIACGQHILKGLVDIPPLVPLLSLASGWALGYSLFAIHILPALAGAAEVLIAGLIARELGGRLFAQGLTALCFTLGPVWLAFNSMLAYDGFDQLFLLFFFFLMIRLLRTGNPKLWVLIGITAGIALMTKYTMLFIGFSLLVSLFLTRDRKFYLSPWLYLGGAACGIIVLPWIVWESRHGWPLFEYWTNYAGFRTYHATPLEFILMQVISFNPLVCPLWLAGLYYFFFHKEGRTYRTLGWTGVILCIILIAARAKFYMYASVFPMLFAGGAVLLERYAVKGVFKPLRWTYAALVLISGVLLIPNGLPALSPDGMAKYFARTSRVGKRVKMDNLKTAALPQIFADRFGWPERVKALADVYNSLSPEDRSNCMIYTADYGSAGAVDLLGGQYGLPKAVSSHLSYFLWGYGNNTGRIMITINIPEKRLTNEYGKVTLVKRLHMDYVMPYENDTPIYICRDPKRPLALIWPGTKHYN